MVTATFLTEDSYLGEITNPLTLNKYNYTLSNYLNYQDPSGHTIETIIDFASLIWSVVEFAKEPSVFNGLMIAWDFTAFIVPVLPGSWVKRVVGGAGDALGLSRLGRQAVRVARSGDEVGCALLKFGDEGLPAIKKAGNEVVQETTEKGAKETGEEVFEETLKEQSDEIGENYEKIFDEQREPNPQADDYYDELADHATGADEVGETVGKTADDVPTGGAGAQGVGNSVTVEGRGNTGRTVPNTLNEQMAMNQVMSNPLEGAIDMSQLDKNPIIMTDPRWSASEGWVKMSNNVNGIEIHFVYNKITGAFDDFKFK